MNDFYIESATNSVAWAALKDATFARWWQKLRIIPATDESTRGKTSSLMSFPLVARLIADAICILQSEKLLIQFRHRRRRAWWEIRDGSFLFERKFSVIREAYGHDMMRMKSLTTNCRNFHSGSTKCNSYVAHMLHFFYLNCTIFFFDTKLILHWIILNY